MNYSCQPQGLNEPYAESDSERRGAMSTVDIRDDEASNGASSIPRELVVLKAKAQGSEARYVSGR